MTEQPNVERMEQEIKEKREEIEQIADFLKYRRGERLAYCGSAAFQAVLSKQGEVFERILSVLEAQLAELFKGFREQ